MSFATATEPATKRSDLSILISAASKWFRQHLIQTIISVLIGTLVGYVANVLLILYVYDGYEKTVGGVATGKGNFIAGGMIWGIGSAVVFGLFGYWRAVGTKQFLQDVTNFPNAIGTLFRNDGVAARIHLLWGAAISLTAAQLSNYVVPQVFSPWVTGVIAVGLFTAAPSIIMKIVASLVCQIWSAVAGVFNPARRNTADRVTMFTVGILGSCIALAFGFFITEPNKKYYLAGGCALAAILLSSSKSSSPGSTSPASKISSFLLFAMLYLLLDECLRPLAAWAHDGGAWENNGNIGIALSSGGYAGPIMSAVGGVTSGIGAGGGYVVGGGIGTLPPGQTGGDPNVTGGSGGGEPEPKRVPPTTDLINRINEVNSQISDPQLTERIQKLINRMHNGEGIDLNELTAIERAQEQIAEKRHQQIVDEQARQSEEWNQKRLEREAAEQAREDAARANQKQIDKTRDLIGLIEDPARRKFLEDLLGRNNDPSKIGDLQRAIRNELLNNNQRNANTAANEIDNADAYKQAEERARTIRDKAIEAEGFLAGAGGLGHTGNIILSGVTSAGRAASDGGDLRTIAFEGAAGLGGALFPGNSAPGALINAGIGGTRAMLNGETDPEAIAANSLLGAGEGVYNHYKGAAEQGVFNAATGRGPSIGEQIGNARNNVKNFFGGGDESSGATTTPAEKSTPGGPRQFLNEPKPGYGPPERSTPPIGEEGAPAPAQPRGGEPEPVATPKSAGEEGTSPTKGRGAGEEAPSAAKGDEGEPAGKTSGPGQGEEGSSGRAPTRSRPPGGEPESPAIQKPQGDEGASPAGARGGRSGEETPAAAKGDEGKPAAKSTGASEGEAEPTGSRRPPKSDTGEDSTTESRKTSDTEGKEKPPENPATQTDKEGELGANAIDDAKKAALAKQLEREAARVSNVLGPKEAVAEDALVRKIDELQKRGAITREQAEDLKAKATGDPILDNYDDPLAQYRKGGREPWTPQIEGKDCSVSATVNGLKAADPNITYEDAEPVLNKYRNVQKDGTLGGIPPENLRPALEELTQRRNVPPPQPVQDVIGNRSPEQSAQALRQFLANNPDTKVIGAMKGHALTITHVNPDGTVHVIEPTGGHADLPANMILFEHSYIMRPNRP